MIRAVLLCAGLTLGLAAFTQEGDAHEGHKPRPAAAARAPYAFPIAAPGSYRLPPIKPAAGGSVLDEAGRRHDLGEILNGRTTVLAFIYTRCGDVCPTATLDMSQLQDLVAKDRRLSRQVQLVTLSFDPEHDTPEIMREHAAHWRSPHPAAPPWLFLTAPDGKTLAPVLAAYNQAVDRKPDTGSAGGPLNHIFRAFLIDDDGLIRNIYSFEFFDPKLVLNDVQTLLIERRSLRAGESAAK
jgi:cytochrome oxidase Cu insertion factor (SCO1/SenC/PrrC family)